jgi:hypothetical protein
LNWNKTISRRRPLWLSGVLMLMLGCGVCGQSGSPSDKTEARKAFESVRDAWKRGEKPAALTQRTPPIHATDGDWMSGLRLLSYKADDDGQLVGSDVNYNVVLELKTAKGKLVKQDAVYVVTTHPHLLVLRKDSL